MKFILPLIAILALSACASQSCCNGKDGMCPMHKSDARSAK